MSLNERRNGQVMRPDSKVSMVLLKQPVPFAGKIAEGMTDDEKAEVERQQIARNRWMLARSIARIVSPFVVANGFDTRTQNNLLPSNVTALELKRDSGVSAAEILKIEHSGYIFVDENGEGWKLSQFSYGKKRPKQASRVAGRNSREFGIAFKNSAKGVMRTNELDRRMYRLVKVEVPGDYQIHDAIKDPKAEGLAARAEAKVKAKAQESKTRAFMAGYETILNQARLAREREVWN